jgi:hypothetical protein
MGWVMPHMFFGVSGSLQSLSQLFFPGFYADVVLCFSSTIQQKQQQHQNIKYVKMYAIWQCSSLNQRE